MKRSQQILIAVALLFISINNAKIYGCPPTVQDIEENVYNVVKIGEQCWMAENLTVTMYNDSVEIPEVTDQGEWRNLSSGAYCWQQNDYETYGALYGALYNMYAIETEKLCPEGWKVPSDEDWKEMEMYLGMTQSQTDSIMWRGMGQSVKIMDDVEMPGGTNETGFSALPGGFRTRMIVNIFPDHVPGYAYFWAYSTIIHNGFERNVGRMVIDQTVEAPWLDENSYKKICREPFSKNDGLSVRCIKD